jgi:hypothetical protein
MKQHPERGEGWIEKDTVFGFGTAWFTHQEHPVDDDDLIYLGRMDQGQLPYYVGYADRIVLWPVVLIFLFFLLLRQRWRNGIDGGHSKVRYQKELYQITLLIGKAF